MIPLLLLLLLVLLLLLLIWWQEEAEGILRRLHSQCRAPSHNSGIMAWVEIKNRMLNWQSHLGSSNDCFREMRKRDGFGKTWNLQGFLCQVCIGIEHNIRCLPAVLRQKRCMKAAELEAIEVGTQENSCFNPRGQKTCGNAGPVSLDLIF